MRIQVLNSVSKTLFVFSCKVNFESFVLELKQILKDKSDKNLWYDDGVSEIYLTAAYVRTCKIIINRETPK